MLLSRCGQVGCPVIASGGRRGPLKFRGGFLGWGRGYGWSTSGWWGQGEGGEQGVGEFLGLGPGVGDADFALALAADDAGGGVEQAVAQGLGFGLGEGGAVQAAQP